MILRSTRGPFKEIFKPFTQVGERRLTSEKGKTISYMVKHISKGINVHVNVVSEKNNFEVRGFLYGTGLERRYVIKNEKGGSLDLNTSKWLLPGSGYVVIVEEICDDTAQCELHDEK